MGVVANMRIIMLTVCGSKEVKSPLTSAELSSFSESWPVPVVSTALKRGKSDALPGEVGWGVAGGREGGEGRECEGGGGLKP